jgi:hypothetical protein
MFLVPCSDYIRVDILVVILYFSLAEYFTVCVDGYNGTPYPAWVISNRNVFLTVLTG